MAILVALWDHKVFPSFLGTWRKNQGFRGLHLRLTVQDTNPKPLGTFPPCSAHLTSRSATSTDSASSLGSFCSGLKAEQEALWDPPSPNCPHRSPSLNPWGRDPGGVHVGCPGWGHKPTAPGRMGGQQPEPVASRSSAAWADEALPLLNLALSHPRRDLDSGCELFPSSASTP